MSTSHAVNETLRSVVIEDGLYGGEEIGVKGPPGLIGALKTHLARHGVSSWCL